MGNYKLLAYISNIRGHRKQWNPHALYDCIEGLELFLCENCMKIVYIRHGISHRIHVEILRFYFKCKLNISSTTLFLKRYFWICIWMKNDMQIFFRLSLKNMYKYEGIGINIGIEMCAFLYLNT